jgi:hypothetical protein
MNLQRAATMCVSLVVLASAHVRTQERSAQVDLAAAMRQIQAGDSFGALFTLNRAVKETALQPAALARLHAVRGPISDSINRNGRRPRRACLRGGLDDRDRSRRVCPARRRALRRRASSRPISRGGGGAAEHRASSGRRSSRLLTPTAVAHRTRTGRRSAAARGAIPYAIVHHGSMPTRDTRRGLEHLHKAEIFSGPTPSTGSGTTAQQAAAAELRQTVHSAPWWPDATLSWPACGSALR